MSDMQSKLFIPSMILIRNNIIDKLLIDIVELLMRLYIGINDINSCKEKRNEEPEEFSPLASMPASLCKELSITSGSQKSMAIR